MLCTISHNLSMGAGGHRLILMGLKSENDVHFSISSLVNLLVLIRIVDLCRKRKKSAFIGKSGEMKKK